MKKMSAAIRVFLCLIFLCFSIFAQDFTPVSSGIEYAKLTRQMKSADGKSENVVFNLLRLDLTKVRLDVVHAMDAAIGTETTSSIATRHGAIAAINAGFFRLDKSIFAGDAAGVLMIDGKLLSESNDDRICLFIKNKPNATEVAFERLKTFIGLGFRKKELKGAANGINRQRGEDDFVIYTPEFHRTTLTSDNGIEIVVKNKRIIKVYKGKGNSLIPSDGIVISLSGKYSNYVSAFKVGLEVMYFPEVRVEAPDNKIFSYRDLNEDIVSGVPQLIKNGKVDIDYEAEKTSKAFVETHHPRTAVARLKDGKFLMITVDGRSEQSGGISLPDLAAFLLELGATDAMNLDGGGSTTMFLNGKIVNKPSDKEGERKVSDAILVFPRKRN
jgi:exopolysaccharide biosynthesis protein